MENNDAPKPGCTCDVCKWVRAEVIIGRGPVKPYEDEQAWETLLRVSQNVRG